jgi:pyruvate dehydrogenase E1 component alpha subunit
VPNPAADRASSYGLDGIIIDGNDVGEVFAIASRALEQARSGGGPSLIEAKTYRHGGHSRADPGDYRPDAEVQEWLARDPIPAFRARMEADGMDHAKIDRIERAAREAVEAAATAAREAPDPAPATLETEMWSDGGSSWRK